MELEVLESLWPLYIQHLYSLCADSHLLSGYIACLSATLKDILAFNNKYSTSKVAWEPLKSAFQMYIDLHSK